MNHDTDKVTAEARQARALLVEIIEAKGRDYVYPKVYDEDIQANPGAACQYLDYEVTDQAHALRIDENTVVTSVTGLPLKPVGAGCLIGHLMLAEGMSKRDLALHEGDGALEVASEHTEAVRFALAALQSEQDSGGTWGRALDKFDNHLKGSFGIDVVTP